MAKAKKEGKQKRNKKNLLRNLKRIELNTKILNRLNNEK